MNGTSAQELLHKVTGTYPSIKTKTVTFDASEKSLFAGVSVTPVITLVHRQTDVQATATATDTGTGPAASTSNAAGRVAPRASVWDGFRAVLSLSVAARLGATIIFA